MDIISVDGGPLLYALRKIWLRYGPRLLEVSIENKNLFLTSYLTNFSTYKKLQKPCSRLSIFFSDRCTKKSIVSLFGLTFPLFSISKQLRNNKCIRVFYRAIKHEQELRCAVIKTRARRASALITSISTTANVLLHDKTLVCIYYFDSNTSI